MKQTKRTFELAPGEWDIFPWGGCVDDKKMDKGFDEEALKENKTFLKHAQHFVSMLDFSIDMLGPFDQDILQDELRELGAKHAGYGVKAHHFPL